jgi:proton glutamate symport protein
MSKQVSTGSKALLGTGIPAILLGSGLQLVPGMHVPALAVRWLGLLLVAGFAFRRRSLTPWIFVAMLVGAELGFERGDRALGGPVWN